MTRETEEFTKKRKAYWAQIRSEPHDKVMHCADCGIQLSRLYHASTQRVWCMDCSMKAIGDAI